MPCRDDRDCCAATGSVPAAKHSTAREHAVLQQLARSWRCWCGAGAKAWTARSAPRACTCSSTPSAEGLRCVSDGVSALSVHVDMHGHAGFALHTSFAADSASQPARPCSRARASHSVCDPAKRTGCAGEREAVGARGGREGGRA
eukprot:2682743-Rhodomonas_salina.2